MNNINASLIIFLMFFWAASIGLGVNLKDWFGWIQVFSGFLLGLSMGQNLADKLIAGIFFAAMTILLGPIAWKRLNH
jgi:hypothetical protein